MTNVKCIKNQTGTNPQNQVCKSLSVFLKLRIAINGRIEKAPKSSKIVFTAEKLIRFSLNMGKPAGTFHWVGGAKP